MLHQLTHLRMSHDSPLIVEQEGRSGSQLLLPEKHFGLAEQDVAGDDAASSFAQWDAQRIAGQARREEHVGPGEKGPSPPEGVDVPGPLPGIVVFWPGSLVHRYEV